MKGIYFRSHIAEQDPDQVANQESDPRPDPGQGKVWILIRVAVMTEVRIPIFLSFMIFCH